MPKQGADGHTISTCSNVHKICKMAVNETSKPGDTSDILCPKLEVAHITTPETLQIDRDFSAFCKKFEELTDKNETPLIKYYNFLLPVKYRWFEIGMLLNISFHRLSIINHLSYDPTACFYSVLALITLKKEYKKLILAIAMPCGGNNFNIAAQFITKIFDIKTETAECVSKIMDEGTFL